MYSIEVIPDNGGFDVSLLLNGEYVKDQTGWHKTPVEMALKVRELGENFLIDGEGRG